MQMVRAGLLHEFMWEFAMKKKAHEASTSVDVDDERPILLKLSDLQLAMPLELFCQVRNLRKFPSDVFAPGAPEHCHRDLCIITFCCRFLGWMTSTLLITYGIAAAVMRPSGAHVPPVLGVSACIHCLWFLDSRLCGDQEPNS